jgi:hypothetical protein
MSVRWSVMVMEELETGRIKAEEKERGGLGG